METRPLNTPRGERFDPDRDDEPASPLPELAGETGVAGESMDGERPSCAANLLITGDTGLPRAGLRLSKPGIVPA